MEYNQLKFKIRSVLPKKEECGLKNNTKLNFIIDIVFYAILIAIFSLALKYALPLIMPFIVAFAVAALVQRPTNFLARKVRFVPRKVWAGIFIFLAYAFVGTALVAIVIGLINEIADFARYIPTFLQNTINSIESASKEEVDLFFENFPTWIADPIKELYLSLAADLPGELLELATTFSSQILAAVGDLGAGSISAVVSVLLSLPNVIIIVVITIIATFFIGLDYDNVKLLMLRCFPHKMRPSITRVKRYATETVFNLLKTYALLMTLTFAELAVGFGLINLCGFNIQYVVPLALLISIVDILPVLGVGTVLLPWGIANFVIGDWVFGLLILLLYCIITVLRNYLEPKIIGKTYGMHPVIMLFAIFVGGKLFGVLGVFALPLTILILKRLYDVGAIRPKFLEDDEPEKCQEGEDEDNKEQKEEQSKEETPLSISAMLKNKIGRIFKR